MEEKTAKKLPVKQRKYLPPKLKLLITVVNRSKTELFLDLISGYECNMQLSVIASGTASTDMLRYLGLVGSDKTVIFSVIRENREDGILKMLAEKFETVKNGKGIAFTTSLTSVIGVAIYRFLSNNGGEAI